MTDKKLLLVDDDGLVLATFGKELRDAGYNIKLADSGDEGLRIAAQEPYPDLAILDIAMPGISGIETAQGLRQLGIPAVFLTAYDDGEYVKQAIANGALGYMVKPIDANKAIPTIESALERAKDLADYAEKEKRLNGALETGNIVNVVIGMLMERHRLGRQDAFELLRRKARSEQRKVKVVAEEVLNAWETFNQLIENK